MNLFKQQQTSSGYKTIPDAIADDIADADTAAVGHCSSTGRRMALVASTMLLVVLAGGGTVWMGDGGITPTAEGLVVATEGSDKGPPAFGCHPATGTFGGVSDTASFRNHPFETCWLFKLRGYQDVYCWTQSYHVDYMGFYKCVPHLTKYYVAIEDVPVTYPNPCGLPCPEVEEYIPQD